MSNTDTNTTALSISAVKGHVGALAFAAKGGSALSHLLGDIARAKAAEREGAVKSALFLLSIVQGDVTQIPVVGSKQGETGNLPYDRYTSTVKTQDGEKKIPGSWFTDVVSAGEECIAARQRIAWIDQGQGEGVPADILAMGQGDKATERKRLKDFISDMRVGLTKGAMLAQHMEAVNTMNPERVKARLPFRMEKDADGNPQVKVFGNTIRISDPSGEQNDDVFSVSQFLQLDPDKAKADPDGGTLKSLKATAARAPRSPAGQGTQMGTLYPIPRTVEALLACFNAIASGLDISGEEGRKLESALLAQMAKDGAVGDGATESVCNAGLAIDNAYTQGTKRFDAINSEKMKRNAAGRGNRATAN
jgi:hypothetical protein